MTIVWWVLGALVVLAAVSLAVLVVLRKVVGRIVLPGGDRWTPVLESDADSVRLPITDDTVRPGEYGLWHDGPGHTTVGPVLEVDEAAGFVRRAVVRTTGAVSSRVRWSGHVHPDPAAMDVDWSEVSLPTPVGPAPAWVVRPGPDGAARPDRGAAQGADSVAARGADPAAARTWAVHVHGIRTTRVTALRTVPAALELGWTSIVPSFRGDGEAPWEGRASHLGAREWADVEAALDHAVANGAERLVIVGWSMGATITHELLARSAHRDRLAGIVLVAPALDWAVTVRSQARRAGLPGPVVGAALGAMATPVLCRTVGLRSPVDVRALSWLRAPRQLPPTLLIHSTGDTTVPFSASQEFADAHPGTVTLAVSEPAEHAWERNVDAVWFDRTITTWASGLAHTGAQE
ncbi:MULTISPECIES: alpha/beta hydrolase family protein [Curtobacterium]|uniref:alpha/beta hydrolase family protein n=1 Tax=Curtobacterium TaxID=2034 RepID=UPI001BDF5A43|nr:alpha/beta fold hydrolase [Curtobacterium flaccumfaciens]MBT1632815.1 alpha/beta hydrolase [Curtobacterium flaccumfaciens pv. oortii]MCS5518473.1 alpha/beta hydrolase [Curtobacterium flaccumfaciens]MCX2846163.1 alpha/beta hydrolase [Curtobacterium flaccumfaciens pv. oortii]